MRFDVYHHLDRTVEAKLDLILERQGETMGLVEDFKIVQEAQTIRILAVAADQQSLKDQLAVLIARDTGATSDELKALLVTATANLDALVALDDSTP